MIYDYEKSREYRRVEAFWEDALEGAGVDADIIMEYLSEFYDYCIDYNLLLDRTVNEQATREQAQDDWGHDRMVEMKLDD